MSTRRLPKPGADNGNWGTILNDFLEVSLKPDGTLNNNVVDTNQIQNNAVTNAQLDAPIQTNLSLASSSVQSVNSQTGAVSLGASDVGALSTANNLSDVTSATTALTNLKGTKALIDSGSSITTSGTILAQASERVDATAGATTRTAPAVVSGPPWDNRFLVKKIDSTSNVVTIHYPNTTGTTSTETLVGTNQSKTFRQVSAVGYEVEVDSNPLRFLEAQFTPVFSPFAYGAKGGGVVDDTVAVQATFAAAVAAKGVVDLGSATFLTSSPISITSGQFAVRGNTVTTGGVLTNSYTDLFEVSGFVIEVSFEKCSLEASAGHVFNCASGVEISFWNFKGVYLSQHGDNYCIWYEPNGSFEDCFVGDNTSMYGAAGATISPWYAVSTGNSINSDTWRRLRVNGNNSTVPFFHVENQAAGYNSDLLFSEITVEECPGGAITALSVNFLTIESVACYDVTTYSSSIFVVGTGAGGNASTNIVVRSSGRRGGSLGSGAYDVQIASAAGTGNIILENAGPLNGAPSYSIPTYATVIGYGVASTVFAPYGINGTGASTTPSRYVGGVVSAAPTAETFATGDFVVCLTGGFWVCTAGGTPGTWVKTATIANTLAAAEIAADGTIAAGSVGLAADSGHVHPENAAWIASDSEFQVWNGDILTTNSDAIMGAGNLNLAKINIRKPITVSDIYIVLEVAGSGTSTGSYAGLYSSSGVLLAVSADIGTSLTSPGVRTLSIPSTALAAGFVWVGLLVNLATTMPRPYGWATAGQYMNAGLGTPSTYRFAYNGTGLTTLPSTITPSNNVEISSLPFWVAIA